MPKCEQCGTELAVGDWPFCPHGRKGSYTNFKDDIPGGVICENYGPNPIRFDSHSERRAYMKAHGLHEKETFCPMPGTDIDPQGIPNPAGYVDEYTLNAGAELIMRNGRAEAPFDGSSVLGGFSSGHLTERDAIAVSSGDARRSARVGRRMDRGTDAGS